ncbi:MAG: cell division protein SepF [Actinomycetia bacterium]|nr:cell division protein SepF [Actinomycetes bacterium]
MSVWQSIKARLGLGDEYGDFDDDYDDDATDEADGLDPVPAYRSPYQTGEPSPVRRVNREPDLDRPTRASSRQPYQERAPGLGMQAVPQVKMHIVEPRAFSEAQGIADRFKLGVPVIMNLSTSDPELSRRLIDFASGLTYGLNGGLQKVSDKVFMLTPVNVDVSAEQRRVLRDKGLFDPNA